MEITLLTITAILFLALIFVVKKAKRSSRLLSILYINLDIRLTKLENDFMKVNCEREIRDNESITKKNKAN